jgi:hypothetical protein
VALSQAEATILKLRAGDILFVKFPEVVMSDHDAIGQALDAVRRAVEASGHGEDVGVILTADAIEMTVIRALRYSSAGYADDFDLIPDDFGLEADS